MEGGTASNLPAPDLSGSQMPVPTVARLTRRPQFLFVRAGLTVRKKTLLIQARKRVRSEDAGPIGAEIGEGFTATKKIGNAVARNRAKRRLRAGSHSLLRRLGLAGTDYVFIARMQTGTADWARLLDDMETALVSLGASLADDQSNLD